MFALEWYLVFLSNMMPASRAALVAVMLVTFLLTRDCQTMFRALDEIQEVGRASLLLGSKPKFKVISWAGWSCGWMFLRQRIIQWPTPLLNGQCTKAWSWSQGTSWGQRVQWELVTVWLRTLCSLSWVGRRLCRKQKRKLVSMESRPGRVLSSQVDSQLVSGFLLSVLDSILNWKLLSSISWVTYISSNALYHIPMVMPLSLSSPPDFTALMASKNSEE